MNLVKQLSAVSKILRCNFTLRDQPLPYDKVFSETGLLPAIMKRSEQLSNFCLGEGLGLTYENVPNSMLGIKVVFDDKVPDSLRLFCAVDVLIELVQSAPNYDLTPLDDLMYD